MNSFFEVQGATWTFDGSPDSTLISESSASFEASSNQKGTPLNAILMSEPEKRAPNAEEVLSYFELALEELAGSIAIGVCSPKEFAAGFKVRGMFYNGGLTNGMVRLLVGFSDLPAAGDVVGVCCKVSSKSDNQRRLEIVYYLNGRCLGVGFDVTVQDEDETLLYLPCIQVDGTVVCHYTAPQNVPTVFERQEPLRESPYVGDWVMQRATRKTAFGGGEFVQFVLPKQQDVLVKVQKPSSHKNEVQARELLQEYDLELKIINTFRTKLTTVLPSSSSLLQQQDNMLMERVEAGHVTSTMMMPPLPLVSVENYIEKSLNGLYQMGIAEDNLVMKCHAAEWICERHLQTFEPVKSYK